MLLKELGASVEETGAGSRKWRFGGCDWGSDERTLRVVVQWLDLVAA